jgi:hypothetical protein
MSELAIGIIVLIMFPIVILLLAQEPDNDKDDRMSYDGWL